MSQTQETIEKVKHAPAETGAVDLILQRWSPRAYADKPISNEVLRTLFEAARWAASSSNDQPWRFLVGRRGDETYRRIFDSLVEFNQGWAKSAPVLILSAARKSFTRGGEGNYHALYDLGAATANLSLQATSQGLHTHSMAGFDHAKARSAFGIPVEFDLGAVTAVGYLGDPNQLPDGLKERELSPRERKPIKETVFSMWEEPAEF